jgi:neopullulanase
MKSSLAVLLTAAGTAALFAQAPVVERVDPPNWWAGMKTHQVQLMLTGENLSGISARSESPQIQVNRVWKAASSSYAFLDIDIDPNALEGYHRIVLSRGKDTTILQYPLLRRKQADGLFRGFDATDVMYMITPDRFANGDPRNDSAAGFADTVNRKNPDARHGGDLRGIINHLDYLADLGVTAVWVNPLVENNMPAYSYHGYSATDLYRIDPRYGTTDLYRDFVHEAHRRGIKVIMDHVSNHLGSGHPWLDAPPFSDWFNGTRANHIRAYHGKIELSDIHGDSLARVNAVQGWFVDEMPDLNQRNLFVGRYLLQNALWWVESTGIDGIREDTAPYVERKYLSEWGRVLQDEYPYFSIVGEVWIGNPVYVAPWQQGSPLDRDGLSHLGSVTDFALYDAFTDILTGKKGVRALYDVVAQDHLYGDPNALLTFVDNHDVKRAMFRAQGRRDKVVMALTVLMTMRGIPCLYYGTEIGMTGGEEHGMIRGDFPGGFPGDSANAFTAQGRSRREAEMYAAVKQLIHLRRSRQSLMAGKLTHLPPVGEVYAYTRTLDEEKTLVLVNNRPTPRKQSLFGLRTLIGGATKLRDLLNGTTITLKGRAEITLPGTTASVYAVEN